MSSQPARLRVLCGDDAPLLRLSLGVVVVIAVIAAVAAVAVAAVAVGVSVSVSVASDVLVALWYRTASRSWARLSIRLDIDPPSAGWKAVGNTPHKNSCHKIPRHKESCQMGLWSPLRRA
jgi:hypothetical protein